MKELSYLKKIYENKYRIMFWSVVVLFMIFDAVGTYLEVVKPASLQEINGMSCSFIKEHYIVAIVTLLAGFLIVRSMRDKLQLEKLFLIICLFIGMIYLIAMPVYSGLDEGKHVRTAYWHANKIMNQGPVDENGLLLWRDGDNSLLYFDRDYYPSLTTYTTMHYYFWEKNDAAATVSDVPSLLVPMDVTILGYIPQALGIVFARLLHWGTVRMFLLGKLFMLLFYMFVVYWSIKIIPVGKEIVMAIALLPMSIEQATSYSYDAMVLCACFLFFSYVMNLKYTEKKFCWYDFLILLMLILVMSMVKIVYIVIGLLFFAIPSKKFKNRKRKWGLGLGILGAGVLGVAATRLSHIILVSTSPDVYEVELYTLGYLFGTYTRPFRVVFDTLKDQLSHYLISLLGTRLGWWDIYIPDIILYGFAFTVVLSAMKKQGDCTLITKRTKFFLLCISMLCILAVMAALLLDYTPITTYVVQGVQGRYFIPVLPLIMLLLRTDSVQVQESLMKNNMIFIYVLQYFVIIRILATVIGRVYV